MAVLCGMPTIQYSARSARDSIVDGDWRRSDVSVICRFVNPRRTCRKFGKVSCTECTGQRNDFELIPTVKMETRNLVEG